MIVEKLQDALKDEIQAVQDYDRLIELDPDHASVYREIRKDELNHAGRLAALLLTNTDDMAAVSSGMEGNESP